MYECDHNVELEYFGHNEVGMEGIKDNPWSSEESFSLIWKKRTKL